MEFLMLGSVLSLTITRLSQVFILIREESGEKS